MRDVTHCLGPGQVEENPMLLNFEKIYYYEIFFSEIKPLEHFKIFTFYIIEKKFLIKKIGEI